MEKEIETREEKKADKKSSEAKGRTSKPSQLAEFKLYFFLGSEKTLYAV